MKSDASKSLAYADVSDSITDVSYLSHRRQLMWALLRIVRSAEVDQADTRPLAEIITDTALELGIEPNDAHIVYPAMCRTQARLASRPSAGSFGARSKPKRRAPLHHQRAA